MTNRSDKANAPKMPGTPFEFDARQLKLLEERHKVPALTTFKAHAEGDFTIIAAGKGVYLWDVDGNCYIDGVSGIGNVGLGYGQTEIAEAVAAQMRTLPFHLSGWNFSTPPSIQLSAKLATLAPPGLTRVFLVSGGSEANETVIKIARLYYQLRGFPNKTGAIALSMSYHGASYGAASLCGLHHMHEGFEPMLPKVRHIPSPYRYRCEFCASESACTLKCADQLEQAILEEGPENVAFFIAEPVGGAGGCIPAPAGYFQRIREICDRYDVLMVADEVVTGFGRTGKMFAIEHWGVVPDMISVAKGISSGYLPLGAVIFKEEIYQTFLSAPEGMAFAHGFTSSGHPVCSAAGLKTIEIMERERLVERAAKMGERFQSALSVFRSSPIIGDVRGMGMMAGLELVRDKKTKEPFPPSWGVANFLRHAALRNELLVRELGDDVILLAPPLVISEAELAALIERLTAAVAETETWVSQKKMAEAQRL
jgi:adenosylmethionine-8-amino-7-oxononanoate aminotransferase